MVDDRLLLNCIIRLAACEHTEKRGETLANLRCDDSDTNSKAQYDIWNIIMQPCDGALVPSETTRCEPDIKSISQRSIEHQCFYRQP